MPGMGRVKKVVAVLAARGVHVRVKLDDRGRGKVPRAPCAMGDIGQRSPQGEQHGEHHQQQDSEGLHRFFQRSATLSIA